MDPIKNYITKYITNKGLKVNDFDIDAMSKEYNMVNLNQFHKDVDAYIKPTKQASTVSTVDSNVDSGYLNNYIGALESGGSGGYKAANPDSSARGKYQHMWSIHKNEISRLTGVKDSTSYLNNPEAQEQYQSHLNKQYLSHLPNLKKLATQNGIDLSDEELVYLEHHHGLGGAQNYLKGTYGKNANAEANQDREFEKAIERGRALGYGGNKLWQNDQKPIVEDLETKATTIAQDKISKKKAASAFNSIWDSITDWWSSIGTSKTEELETERVNAKKELLLQPEYASLVKDRQSYNKLVYGVNDTDGRLHNNAAKQAQNELDEDINTDGGIFDGVMGLDAKRNEQGVAVVNINKANAGLGGLGTIINMAASATGLNTKEGNYMPLDEVMKLTEHPANATEKSKYKQIANNEHLLKLQNTIAKSEIIKKEGLSKKHYNYIDYIDTNLKTIEASLIQKYGDLQDPAVIEQAIQDPELAQYEALVNQKNQGIEGFKAESMQYKLADLYETSKEKIQKDLDNSFKNNDVRLSNALLTKAFPQALENITKIPGDLVNLGASLVNAVTGTDFREGKMLSSAYGFKELKPGNSDSIFTGKNKLSEDVYTLYDDDGQISGFEDGNGYAITFDKDSKQFMDLAAKEKAANPTGETSLFENVNWRAAGYGALTSAVEFIPQVVSTGGFSIGAKAAGAMLANTGKLSRTANLLTKMGKSQFTSSLAGVFGTYAGKTMDGVIQEGNVDSNTDIFTATTSKLLLEGVIEGFSEKFIPVISKPFFKEAIGKLTARELNTVAKIFDKKGYEGVVNYTTGLVKKVGGGMLSEAAEEGLASVTEPVLNTALNKMLDTTFNEDITLEDSVNAMAMGGLGATVVTAPMAFISQSNTASMRNAIYAGAKDNDTLLQTIDILKQQQVEKISSEGLPPLEQAKKLEDLDSQVNTYKSIFTETSKNSAKVLTPKANGDIYSQDFQQAYVNNQFQLASIKNRLDTEFDDVDTKEKRGLEAQRDVYEARLKDMDYMFNSNIESSANAFDIATKKTMFGKPIMSPTEYFNYKDDIDKAFTGAVDKFADSKYTDSIKEKLITSEVNLQLKKNKSKYDENYKEDLAKQEEAHKEIQKLAAENLKKKEEQERLAKEQEKLTTIHSAIHSGKSKEDIIEEFELSDKEFDSIEENLTVESNKLVGETYDKIFSGASTYLDQNLTEGVNPETSWSKVVAGIDERVNNLPLSQDAKSNLIEALTTKLHDNYQIADKLESYNNEVVRQDFIGKIGKGEVQAIDTPIGTFYLDGESFKDKTGNVLTDNYQQYVNSFLNGQEDPSLISDYDQLAAQTQTEQQEATASLLDELEFEPTGETTALDWEDTPKEQAAFNQSDIEAKKAEIEITNNTSDSKSYTNTSKVKDLTEIHKSRITTNSYRSGFDFKIINNQVEFTGTVDFENGNFAPIKGIVPETIAKDYINAALEKNKAIKEWDKLGMTHGKEDYLKGVNALVSVKKRELSEKIINKLKAEAELNSLEQPTTSTPNNIGTTAETSIQLEDINPFGDLMPPIVEEVQEEELNEEVIEADTYITEDDELDFKFRVTSAMTEAWVDPETDDELDIEPSTLELYTTNYMGHTGTTEEEAKRVVEEYLNQRRINNKAKRQWITGIGKKNPDLKTNEDFKNYLQSLPTSLEINPTEAMIFLSKDQARVYDGKVKLLNTENAGLLPVKIVIYDGQDQYVTYMHSSEYYTSESRYKGKDPLSSVSPSFKLDELAVDYYNNELGTTYTLESIIDAIINNKPVPDDLYSLANKYVVRSFGNKLFPMYNPTHYKAINTYIKGELYNAYQNDTLDEYSLKLENLSNGVFKSKNVTSDTNKAPKDAQTIKVDPKDPNSFYIETTLPNLNTRSIPVNGKELSRIEKYFVYYLIKSLTNGEQTYQGHQITDLLKLFTPWWAIKEEENVNGKKVYSIKIDKQFYLLDSDNAVNLVDSYFKFNTRINLDAKRINDKNIPKVTFQNKDGKLALNYNSYNEFLVDRTEILADSVEPKQFNLIFSPIQVGATSDIKIDNLDNEFDIDMQLSTAENVRIVSDEIIEEDLNWLESVLPQITAVEGIIGNPTSNVEVLGAFVSSLEILDDFGATQGIYYTNKTKEGSNRSQIRHEAFEAVWALYVNQGIKDKVLAEAKQVYPKPTEKDLKLIRDSYPGIEGQELIDKYYKEELADNFNEYSRLENPKSIIFQFFNWLKDLIRSVLSNKGAIERLFRDIETGKFANLNPIYNTKVQEYSSIQNGLTPNRKAKIAKTLANVLISLKDRKTGDFMFLDLTKVNSKDLKEAFTITPEKLANAYRAYTKVYKNGSQETIDVVAQNILNKGDIYQAVIAQAEQLYSTTISDDEDYFDSENDDNAVDKGKVYDQAAHAKNPAQNEYPIIKALLSSILKRDNSNNAVFSDETYLPITLPKGLVSNTLLRFFAGKNIDLSDNDAYLKELENLVEYKEDYKMLHNTLVQFNSNPKTKHIVRQFISSTYHEKNNFYNLYQTENGPKVLQNLSKGSEETVVTNWNKSLTERFSKGDRSQFLTGIVDSLKAQLNNPNRDALTRTLNMLGLEIHKNALLYQVNELGVDEKAFIKGIIFMITNPNGLLAFNQKPSLNENGDPQFKSDISDLKTLAKAQLFFEDNLHESMINVAGEKMWLYSLPSYLSRQLNNLKNKDELAKLKSKIYHKRSVLLKAMETGFEPQLIDINQISLRTINEQGFVSGKTDIVENTNNTKTINDHLTSVYAHNNGAQNNGMAVGRLLSFNSHSRNNVFITLPKFYSAKVNGSLNPEVTEIFMGYLLDEVERIKYYQNNPSSYKNISKNWNTNYLFPQLSLELKDTKSDSLRELHKVIFQNDILDQNGELKPLMVKMNDKQVPLKRALEMFVNHALNGVLEQDTEIMKDLTIGMTQSLRIDQIENNTINGLIGSIEHTKLFLGDPAQYKDTIDVTKRTHSTTSSGLIIDMPFNTNYVLLEGIEEPSDLYTDDYIQGELFEARKQELLNHIREGNIKYEGDVEAYATKLARQDVDKISYKKVDKTDAAAYVTLPYWREILTSMGRWNSTIHDPIYEKLLKGEATNQDVLKIMTTLQPMKTVGYWLDTESSENEAISQYFKWSILPLHPAMLPDNSELKELYRQAIYDDEGNMLPIEKQVHIFNYTSTMKSTHDTSKVLKKGDQVMSKLQSIDSRAFKMQQDLSSKSDKKDQVDEPSQTRKNIIQGLLYDTEYAAIDGSDAKTGKEIQSELSQLDKELVLRKYKEFIAKIDYQNGKINNKQVISDFLLEEFKDKDIPEDLENYLRSGNLDINKIPQYSKILQNKFSSLLRKLNKQKLQGMAYIQTPEVKLTRQNIKDSSTDIKDLGNKLILLDSVIQEDGIIKLKAPSFKEGVYKPSLVFLPHSLIKNLKGKVSVEDIKQYFKDNPKLLKGIGSRIPNQGGPSIDSLEIGGILPSYMGDTVVTYEDITRKYGSDYDVDKLYVTGYNWKINKNGEPEVLEYYENPNEEQLQQLYEEKINSLFNASQFKSQRDALYDKINMLSNNIEFINKKIDKKSQELFREEFNQVVNLANNRESTLDNVAQLENVINLYFTNKQIEKTEIRVLLDDIQYLKSLIKIDNTYEDFVNSSTIDKHSSKRLQNRKVDLYRQILESPNYHYQNITPLDNIKDDIRDLVHDLAGGDPVNYRKGLGFFSPIEQVLIKATNREAKASLGLAANAATDFVNARFRKLLYNLGLNGGVNYSNIMMETDGSYNLISDVIGGGYLSAFVDAEKDPFIKYANINKFTFPIVNMLEKSGYNYKQTIPFIMHPIINRILYYQDKESDLFVYKNTSIELVALEFFEQYKLENKVPTLTKEKYLKEVLFTERPLDPDLIVNSMENNKSIITEYFKSGKNTDSLKSNLDMLYLFNQLKNHTKVESLSIITVKQDVNGSGATFDEAFRNYEQIRKVLNISPNQMQQFVSAIKSGVIPEVMVDYINNRATIDNYVHRIVDKNTKGEYELTAEGMYMLATTFTLVDFMSAESIREHPVTNGIIYDVFNHIGKTHVEDVDIIKQIKDDVYTFALVRSLINKGYNLYGTPNFLVPSTINPTIIGEDTIGNILFNPNHPLYDDVNKLLPTFKKNVTYNTLNTTKQQLLKTDNFKGLSTDTSNLIHNEIKSLYEFDITSGNNLLEKLLIPELMSSGFSFTKDSILNLIPIELIGKMVDPEAMKDVLNNDMGDFINQFFYKNSSNPKIVNSFAIKGEDMVPKSYIKGDKGFSVLTGRDDKGGVYTDVDSGVLTTKGSVSFSKFGFKLDMVEPTLGFKINKPFVKDVDKIHHPAPNMSYKNENNNSSTIIEEPPINNNDIETC